MIKKGYKVVTDNLMSATSFLPGSISYKIGESVFPKEGCGPLTVFKNIDGAVHFRKNMPYPLLKLFRCFYTLSASHEVWYKQNDGYGGYAAVIKKLLDDLLLLNSDCILPDSVDLADEVILVEKL